jgi:hypothetical protein
MRFVSQSEVLVCLLQLTVKVLKKIFRNGIITNVKLPLILRNIQHKDPPRTKKVKFQNT